MKKLLTALASLALLSACGTGLTETSFGSGQAALTGGDAGLVLALVNDLETDFVLLDETAGLDRRAATNILGHRAGADGFFPSEDDDLFETLAELDAVPYVGASALERLLTLARTLDFAQPEIVEGVEFTADEVSVILWGVNGSTVEYLDDVVGLDARAARNLAANAPYVSIEEMGAQGYVGVWALTQLRFWATRWRLMQGSAESGTLAGTFDGVTFDEVTAAEALRIASDASLEQLTLFGGLWTTAARAVVGGRPYATVAEVAAAWGVGRETMKQLKIMAERGDWPAGELTCEPTFAAGTSELVDVYHVAINAFDYHSGPGGWSLTHWTVPTCLDPTDPATAAALTDHAIEAMGWATTRDQFPQMLVLRDPMHTPSAFVSHLYKSIDEMDEVKNTKLANGDWDAPADLAVLTEIHDALRAEILAGGDQVWSWRLDISASECSEYASVMVDLSSGQMITLRRGPSC